MQPIKTQKLVILEKKKSIREFKVLVRLRKLSIIPVVPEFRALDFHIQTFLVVVGFAMFFPVKFVFTVGGAPMLISGIATPCLGFAPTTGPFLLTR